MAPIYLPSCEPATQESARHTIGKEETARTPRAAQRSKEQFPRVPGLSTLVPVIHLPGNTPTGQLHGESKIIRQDTTMEPSLTSTRRLYHVSQAWLKEVSPIAHQRKKNWTPSNQPNDQERALKSGPKPWKGIGKCDPSVGQHERDPGDAQRQQLSLQQSTKIYVADSPVVRKQRAQRQANLTLGEKRG